jgi:flagellar protein FliO/FliZ
MSRSSARADTPGVQLPAQQTYPVQSEAPLFTSSPQADPPQAPAAQPLGLPESSGPGFDLFDIGIKLAAVLGLAYGSLVLLKRGGFGGATAAGTGGSPQAMRVVSSLALAPNRTVHVIKVPGGRTLLVGATPNAVNLLADLGEVAETDTPEAASFFDVLKARL